MSFVLAVPEAVNAAAAELAGLGSVIGAANAAAAVPTTALAAAAGDEVSVALAALFGSHGQEYQSLSAQVARLQDEFVRNLQAGSHAYAAAEATNAVAAAEEQVLALVNAPSRALTGRALIGDGANGTSPGQAGRDGGWLWGNGGNGAPGAAGQAGKPYVWRSIYRFEGQASVFWEDAPDGLGVNYRDLYPEPPPPGMVPSCAEGGVLGIICASVASVMGTEAIKLITGIGETLLGRLLVYDALEMSYRTITIRKDPSTPKITELVDYEQFCGVVADDAAQAAKGSTITPRELRDWLDSGRKLALIDVRDPVEWDIVHIDGAQLIPKSLINSGEGLAKLPQDRTAVLYCKTGVRSAEALAAVKKAGFSDAVHLQGGIVAWAKQMQPDMVMY